MTVDLLVLKSCGCVVGEKKRGKEKEQAFIPMASHGESAVSAVSAVVSNVTTAVCFQGYTLLPYAGCFDVPKICKVKVWHVGLRL